MPSRAETIADAIRLFEGALYPGGLTAQSAWLGIYQVLLWYETVGAGAIASLPHIIDADKLRPSASKVKRGIGISSRAWQERALAVQGYIADQLGVPNSTVPSTVGLLFRLSDYEDLQKQNPLGTAFAGLIRYILQKFGNPAIEYKIEVDATTIFPGIPMTGRSTKPYIDILALKAGLPRAVISSKWGVRHDRINEITNECPIYKAAALRMRTTLDFIVVTNEFDPARLGKILVDPCINALVHVHRPVVTDVCGMNGRLAQMFDLTELIEYTRLW